MKDHPHTIDRWDDSGDNLIEEIAAVGDFMVALATYKAAIERWPKDKITLRNRARLIEKIGSEHCQRDAKKRGLFFELLATRGASDASARTARRESTSRNGDSRRAT